MVTSPCGDGVVVIGGYNDTLGDDSNSIFQLKGNGVHEMDKKWTKMAQTLQCERVNHLAIPFPGVVTIYAEVKVWPSECSRTL